MHAIQQKGTATTQLVMATRNMCTEQQANKARAKKKMKTIEIIMIGNEIYDAYALA